MDFKKGQQVIINPSPAIGEAITDNLDYARRYLSKDIQPDSILTVVRDTYDNMVRLSFKDREGSMFKKRVIPYASKRPDVKLDERLFEL